MNGKFITLEGGEGCGKSTQIKLLANSLILKHIETITTKEPGGTPDGAVLRQMLVTGDKDKFDAITESLLYFADRRIHLQNLVWPALKQGKWVISDRYADSTKAYQYFGYNKRIDLSVLDGLYQIVAGDFKPDLTLILDIDPEEGMRRSFSKAQGMETKELRFESRDMEFHQNLRKGFLEIAKQEPQRCMVIDATGDVETVHTRIMRAIEQKFGV